MNTKEEHKTKPGKKITFTWSGKEWQSKCTVPAERLNPGYSFTVALPDDAILPDQPAGDCRLLFSKDTFLYLPLLAVKGSKELDSLVEKHFRELGKRSPSEKKSYVPILLLEDLCVQKSKGSDNWRTCQCKCQIPGNERIFPTLNQLASYALRQWSDREAATIDVFHGVYFLHSRKYLQIHYMRERVVNGQPLPSHSDPSENTMILPGMDNFLT
jgi:hypothetical protein